MQAIDEVKLTKRKRTFKKRNRRPLPLVKECKGCKRTLNKVEHFYKAGNNTYQSRCITYGCHLSFRKTYAYSKSQDKYIKTGTGVNKLSPERKEQLKNMIAEKKTLKNIATTLNIKYPTLIYWNKKGQLKNL